MIYQEFEPSPALAPYIECYWVSRTTERLAKPTLSRILPDGCMDVFFDLTASTSHAVGTMREASLVTLEGAIDLLGIRFRPTALPALIRHPADELTDQIVDLGDVWADTLNIQERLSESSETGTRIGILESALLRLLPTWGHLASAASRASELIRRSHGLATVDSLSERLAISGRQLERYFRDHVGVAPKEACRIERFRRASRLVRAAPQIPLVEVALGCGYFDQAHMTRDFRQLARTTPAAYRREI